MEQSELTVVGAGLAGLTVARGAAAAGLSVAVLDKGRGVGGRLATRRAGENLWFDHGAQYLRPKDPGFRGFLDDVMKQDALAPWDAVDGALVGVPGMSALAKHLAKGLDITSGRRLGQMARRDGVWELTDTENEPFGSASEVVLAMPPPQIDMVLGPDHPASKAVSGVRFAPCWAMMIAFESDPGLPSAHHDEDPDATIAWVARDGSKPARCNMFSYVIHGSTGWSRAHLEDPAEDVRAQLIDALGRLTDLPLPGPSHVAVHRWRFSTVEAPLGQPYLALPDLGLYLCGDWCLGARAEHAWLSAQGVLSALDLPARAGERAAG